MLRKMAILRNIRFRIAGMVGARMFSSMMTCVLTQRKQSPGVQDMLPKVPSGAQPVT